jgi:inner membrane protein involved in colicin E2 resistance
LTIALEDAYSKIVKSDLILKVEKPKEPCPDFKNPEELVWDIQMTDAEKKVYVYNFPELLHPNQKISGMRNQDSFIKFDYEKQVLSIEKQELVALFNKSQSDEIDVIS